MKVFLLGLDGVPFSLLKKFVDKGIFENFKSLLNEGEIRELISSLPPVSNVAWTCVLTGRNPGKHGVYGFIDKDGDNVYIPFSNHIKTDTIYHILSKAGKKIISVNVPPTYPPFPINGVLISGFMCTKLEKGVYPEELLPKLKELEYKIDPDVSLPHKGKFKEFLEDLNKTFDARIRVTKYLLQNYDWDFFHLHVMETDRINHFFFEWGEYKEDFENFYKKVDNFIGELKQILPSNTKLIIMSDHGFCKVEKEADTNKWLIEKGFLKLKEGEQMKLNYTDDSKAISLIPGRFYILKNEGTKEELKAKLEECDFIDKIFDRDEVYCGNEIKRAPDFIALPVNGIDLKASLKEKEKVFSDTIFKGMHTYEDAFFYINDEIKVNKVKIYDPAATVLRLFGIDIPADFDGKCVF